GSGGSARVVGFRASASGGPGGIAGRQPADPARRGGAGGDHPRFSVDGKPMPGRGRACHQGKYPTTGGIPDMSSSLLLVLIVVVWLFVLAPLVVNTREPIRRTSEGLGRTRLLHRGGESVPTRRRRPALSERDIRRGDDDADESLETV